MKLKITTQMIAVATGTTEDGQTFEFAHVPDRAVEPLMFQKDDLMVVGYLSHDNEKDPFHNCDDMGSIYSQRQNASKEDREMFFSITKKDKASALDKSYAVMLDYFQCGNNSAWTVSGSAKAKRLSPERLLHNAAVWVPGKAAQVNCDKNARIFAFMAIEEAPSILGSTSVQYELKAPVGKFDKEDQQQSPLHAEYGKFFSVRHEAFDHAAKIIMSAQENGLLAEPTEQQLEAGRRRACEDMAAHFCDLQSAFENGEVFGVVVQTYTREENSTKWKSVEIDGSWGYVGTRFTLPVLYDDFDSVIERLESDDDVRPH